jgi:hypothetical protein
VACKILLFILTWLPRRIKPAYLPLGMGQKI